MGGDNAAPGPAGLLSSLSLRAEGVDDLPIMLKTRTAATISLVRVAGWQGVPIQIHVGNEKMTAADGCWLRPLGALACGFAVCSVELER